MKKTCYALKSIIAVYAIISLAVGHGFSFKEVIVLLSIVFVNIYREKYNQELTMLTGIRTIKGRISITAS